MARVIMICGGLCCGKSTYAEALRRERGGVILSIDGLMLSLFGPDAGEMHDEYARRDGRVKVIHQQNGGVSSARNVGLSIEGLIPFLGVSRSSIVKFVR